MNNILRDIEKGVSTLLVQNPDEFLETFNSLTYFNYNLIDRILFLVRQRDFREINRGAMGVIYEFGPNNVIKKSVNCVEGDNRPFSSELCKLARNNSKVFIIKNTLYNKNLILCPNYFSESLIGSILQNLKPYTPSFMNINGCLFDNRDPEYPLYIISERLVNFDWNTPELIPYYLFQIFFGLYIAQNTLKYTHYDLHAGNIMLRPKLIQQIQKYDLGNGLYVYSRHNFDSVIIDYGFNRCETSEHIISPSTFGILSNNYEFNEYVDVTSLLHFIILQVMNGNPTFSNVNLYTISYILANYLRIETEQIFEYFRTYHDNPTRWRPIPQNLYLRLPLSMIELLTFIVTDSNLMDMDRTINTYNDLINAFNNRPNTYQYLSSTVNIENENIITYKLPTIFTVPLTHNLFIPVNTVDLPFIESRPYYEIFVNNYIDDGRRFRINFENFNRTRGTNRDASNQFISMAILTQPSQNTMNPFRFRSDCCRIDSKEYFQNNIFEEGIAINGSFFNISSDFKPVGLYKTGDYITDFPIPTEYQNRYASIVVHRDTNDLDIISIQNAREYMDDYNIIITTGPMLIVNGRNIFTEDLLSSNTVRPNIFNCRNPGRGEIENQNILFDNIFNCRTVLPGELKHAANPNPRSILATGTHIATGLQVVLFINIEGRDQRGTGMDLSQVAQFLTSIEEINIRTAVNLDGGGSTLITWKHENEITILNPLKLNSYPVGNILSYVRERVEPMDVENV